MIKVKLILTDLIKTGRAKFRAFHLKISKFCLTTKVNLNDRKEYDTNDHPIIVLIFKTVIKIMKICWSNRIFDWKYSKQLTQITVTLEKNILSPYLNKILRKVCIFEGILYIIMTTFFVHQRTFDGYLEDFKFIPFIKDTQVS